MRSCLVAGLAVVVALITSTASARVLFVNNRTGSDRADASSLEIVGPVAGPVRSISRALELAAPGDTIYVTNTGVPYYDSLSLVGRRLSGSALRPFRILGNGSILTGAMTLPPTAWQEVGIDVWKVVPYRKGHFQLVRNGKALAEVKPSADKPWYRVPKLAAGEWCAFKGAIYFQAEKNTDPAEQNFAIARQECGITFLDVHDVLVEDLVIRHFRLDGVHLHDRSEGIALSNVGLIENGRAGLSVRGTSVADLAQTAVRGNRKFSVLIEEFGGVDLVGCDLDVAPTVRD